MTGQQLIDVIKDCKAENAHIAFQVKNGRLEVKIPFDIFSSNLWETGKSKSDPPDELILRGILEPPFDIKP